MSWESKVLWTEGLFLRPQHFQQQDRYHEHNLSARVGRITPYPWGVTALVLIAVGLFLAGSGFLFSTLRSELVPAEDVGILSATVSAPEGTGYAEMDRYMLDVQARILPLLEEGAVRSVITRTPGGFGQSDDFNSGSLIVFLRPWEERGQTTQDVVGEINRILAQVPAVRGNASVRSSLGRGRGQPINFVIAGSTYQDLARARDRIIAAAAGNPGIVNLDSDYKESKPQLRIDVDTDRAGDLGVSVEAVSQALQSLLGSRRVSTYLDRGEEYRVVVQAEDSARATRADLASIHVRSRTGALIPLSNLVRVRETAGARDLGRFNKMRAITLSGGLAPGYSLGEALDFLEQQGVRYRLDPVIEPIGFGFAASLGRYLETRRRYPEAAMMMGIGNLTELTDSATGPAEVTAGETAGVPEGAAWSTPVCMRQRRSSGCWRSPRRDV